MLKCRLAYLVNGRVDNTSNKWFSSLRMCKDYIETMKNIRHRNAFVFNHIEIENLESNAIKYIKLEELDRATKLEEL